MKYTINLIELVKEDGDFRIEYSDGVRIFKIPFLHLIGQNMDQYNKNICRLLRLYICDSNDLVFHFHYSFSYAFIEEVRKFFLSAKIVFTIHYLSWSERLCGNILLFRKILSEKASVYMKSGYTEVLGQYNIEKKLFEKVDYIICLSQDTYNLIKNEYAINKKKIFLIPNGLKPIISSTSPNRVSSLLRQKYGLSTDEKIILFVGRVHQIKGIRSLISCFNRVYQQYPNCRLVIVGDGEIGIFIKKCKNVYSKISFTGRLNLKEVYSWYQIADIGIFPSYYEECSYVGIEMMMHGLPIVASDGYSVKNMFQHKENAIVASIGNINRKIEFENQLTEALLLLFSSEALREEMGSQAKEVYNSYYTLENMINNYKLFFKKISL